MDIHMTQGPRRARVDAALRQAVQALRPPLTAEERSIGWTDDLRQELLGDVESTTLRLAEQRLIVPADRPGWGRELLDVLDPMVSDARGDSVISADNAIHDILFADSVLAACDAMVRFLAQTLPEAEKANGWTDARVEQLRGVLGLLRDRLANGHALTREDFSSWDEVLRDAGFRRRNLFVEPMTYHRPGRDFEFDLIEVSPPGEWWAWVTALDTNLRNLAAMDWAMRNKR